MNPGSDYTRIRMQRIIGETLTALVEFKNTMLISESDMLERFKNALHYSGYKSFLELAGKTEKELLKHRGIGKLGVSQITREMELRGLKLKPVTA